MKKNKKSAFSCTFLFFVWQLRCGYVTLWGYAPVAGYFYFFNVYVCHQSHLLSPIYHQFYLLSPIVYGLIIWRAKLVKILQIRKYLRYFVEKLVFLLQILRKNAKKCLFFKQIYHFWKSCSPVVPLNVWQIQYFCTVYSTTKIHQTLWHQNELICNFLTN